MSLKAEFVDSISATAAVRLDLAAEPYGIVAADLSPPPLRRAVTSSMLRDGARIPASAYDNRTLRITVEVVADDEAEVAALLAPLHRELARPTNVLRWHSGNAGAVYFRTFKAPDYGQELGFEEGVYTAVLTIPAEPFAYGLRVDSALVTVTNDPAVAGGLVFDMDAVLGDEVTPLFVRLISSHTLSSLVVATWRRPPGGTAPGAYQAEAGVLGADTTVQPNSGLMSGSGSNYVRTTFATNTAMATRVVVAHTASAGEFRVLVRHRRTSAAAVVKGRVNVESGSLEVAGPTKTHPADITGPYFVDYDDLSLPLGAAPPDRGYDAVEYPSTTAFLRLQLERTSGTGDADTDYTLLLPADAEYATFDLTGTGVDLTASVVGPPPEGYCLVIDGPNDSEHMAVLPAGNAPPVQVHGAGPVRRPGGALPQVAPGMENRVYLVNTTAGVSPPATLKAVFSYWPRYQYIAP